jgi:hypothetical protein
MASTFSDLGIELMATGENAGTWGTKTNTNLQIVEKAVAGYVEQAVTSGGTTALSITDGDATESTSVARHAVIKLTGTITGNSIVTVPDSIEKVYIVTNGTSGAYTVQFKTASGTGITFGVSEKTTRLVYSDGTNLVDAGFGGATDMEGRELVLDADGDTTITADTDDQIDIKIAGADDFQFTANTFTAQSGSSIVVPDGGLTFGSTAITSTAAELNLLDGVSGLVQADLTKLAAVDSTAAELNIVDGGTSATSTTVADADRVVFNDNGTMVQVAVTDLAAYFDDEITAMPNLVTTAATTVGALNSGSITSGFGTIDTGSSTITTTGLISGGSLDIDNVLINGTTIGHTDDTDLMTVASGLLTVAGEVSMTTLDIGGTNVTSTAAELNLVDGITAGTVSASLAVIADSNKDISGFRNVTLTGELDAATGDFSGDVDVDGTLEADAITVNGTALASVIAGTTVANATTAAVATTVTITDNESTNENNAIIFTAGGDLDGGNLGLESDGDLKYNPSTGTLSATNISVSGTFSTVNSVTMDANNAVIFEGSTADAHETTLTSIDATGDRTISLPNVSGTLPVLAAASTTQISSTPEELNILDGVTATATEINLIDGDTARGTTAVADADGILHNDGGTMRMTSAATFKTYFTAGVSSAADDLTAGDAAVNLTTSSGDITIDAAANDSDIIFKGTDATADITMLTLDGSDAGTATFNHDIILGNNSFIQFGGASETISGDGTDMTIAANNLTIDAAADIILDAAGNDFNFKAGGTEVLRITNSSSDVIIRPVVDAKDLIFQQRDGTEVARIEDNGTFNVVTSKLAINGTAVTSTAAELNLLDGVSGLVQADLTKLAAVDSTAAELNIVDGGTSATSTTVADADRVVLNDAGTMVQVAMTDIKTYIGGGTSWQAVKTSNFTASAGQGIFANTTSASFTVTLPASPDLGDEVSIKDYAGTFDTNALTVGRNSQPIEGVAADLTVSVERAGFTLVYSDSTQGWLLKDK